jgi:hypothetical protein
VAVAEATVCAAGWAGTEATTVVEPFPEPVVAA